MNLAIWSAMIGGVLVLMALSDSVLSRLPLSSAMLYLGLGVVLSPAVLSFATLTPGSSMKWLEHAAEIVVLLSLFTSGLNMGLGLGDRRWLLPLRLATLSMVLTVAAVACLAVLWLDFPLGAAILLGAILAPTDPVLASDVHVNDASDTDRLRFSLTGEAGLNDGTAFPLVLLGLGLLGLTDLGNFGLRWVLLDVLWAGVAGLAIGALLGAGVGKLVLYLRRTHREATGLDNFLSLGLIGLAYGTALLVHGYGFLAVFAAGFALRREEQKATEAAHGQDAEGAASAVVEAEAALADPDVSKADAVATDPQKAPAYMAHAVLAFNEQLEKIGEVAIVVIVGLLLWSVEWRHANWPFVAVLLLVVRPLAVIGGLVGARVTRTQRRLIGWFGIRGIGSIYYVAYAANSGLDTTLLQPVVTIVLSTIVVSAIVHGISVTPLMRFYEKRRASRQ